MDGTLRGMDDERDEFGQPKNRSLLPRWKRARFAPPRRRRRKTVGDGDAPSTRSRLLYVDDKREAVDTTDEGEDAEELARGERERVEAEADELLLRGPTKEKYRADDVTFRPAKSWMGNNRAEKVGEWRAEVWDAAAKMAKRRVTRLGEFRVDGTFSDYLESASQGAADAVETAPVEEFRGEDEGEDNRDRDDDDDDDDDEGGDGGDGDDKLDSAETTSRSPARLVPCPFPRRDRTPPRLVPHGAGAPSRAARRRRNRGR